MPLAKPQNASDGTGSLQKSHLYSHDYFVCSFSNVSQIHPFGVEATNQHQTVCILIGTTARARIRQIRDCTAVQCFQISKHMHGETLHGPADALFVAKSTDGTQSATDVSILRFDS
jgi:hypothetical protein